ncbi:hypothetical protein GE061_006639 [Apolygus lucorum]|uniref:Uncharacterized protein n=1 Tax=Apolygus lucorum TaxID=248454 RepID=A0A6A4J7E2_APOLU|nr:hypothetical protein GE061_006639 [Apolygus lucorum]
MLKCAGRGAGGCGCDRKGDMSSSTCSSISSLAEEDVKTTKKKMEVSKHNAVGAFLASLSPRNLFKGLRRPDHHSMPKAERKEPLGKLLQFISKRQKPPRTPQKPLRATQSLETTYVNSHPRYHSLDGRPSSFPRRKGKLGGCPFTTLPTPWDVLDSLSYYITGKTTPVLCLS